MSSVQWTKQQIDAIETGNRRLLVSAAAGSGKTAVLVERIIRRLTDENNPIRIDELLVMTFTKAAAAEMKAKIRKRLTDPYQLAILDSACISTIDSFCMNVIRDHTDELDIDPAVRIADEAELALMKADVLEELLDEKFTEADKAFTDFVEAYTTGNIGNGLEKLIMEVYESAQNSPWPMEWYDNVASDDSYIKYIVDYCRSVITGCRRDISEARILCNENMVDGEPIPYYSALDEDIVMLADLQNTDDYRELNSRLGSVSWTRLSTRGRGKYDEELKTRIKAIREEVKKQITELVKLFAYDDADTLLELSDGTQYYIQTIIELAREFNSRFQKKKREKKVIDFGDQEHLVLELFWNTENGRKVKSSIALEYRDRFDEIYIDEYQDSNDVQEWLLEALDKGRTFMVGDIKQSIYSFRGAEPGIFRRKYREFIPLSDGNDTDDTRIELSTNFRSLPGIIDGVNTLFRRIMHDDLGGVEYSDEAALHPGRTDAEGGSIRMLIADSSDCNDEEEKRTAEAGMVAREIQRLHDEEGCNYSDIVILLRSANKRGDIFLNTLLDSGIPAFAESRKGYFDSMEVRTVTAALEAIDNPKKDIPMAAFLRSPMIGMTDSELAYLAADCMRSGAALSDVIDGAISERLDEYRRKASYMSIPDFITFLYDDTGYYDYVSTLPSGLIRRANLDKLRSMAGEYASSGYSGLFNFIRYIDTVRTYDTDCGEASIIAENDDAVRIMSIHKSKGLEFPVCFLAASDVGFNFTDMREKILVDKELGIGCEYIDLEERTRRASLRQNAIKIRKKDEIIGEELRILYVAMTRARERLYITGVANGEQELTSSVMQIRNATSYLSLMKYAGVMFDAKLVMAPDSESRNSLGIGNNVTVPDRDDHGFRYAFLQDVELCNKMSVSEIKHRWMEELAEENDERGVLPEYTLNSEGGAKRGTLYHKIMEKLPYEKLTGSREQISEETDKFLKSFGEDYRTVKKEDIIRWLNSETGQKVTAAACEGRLYRERQFIMAVPANELRLTDSEGNAVVSAEPVLVQGIIDAYILDEEGVTLIDYKTDRVTDVKQLKDRYRAQMEYYAKALERMKGRPVRNKVLWSFALGEQVEI